MGVTRNVTQDPTPEPTQVTSVCRSEYRTSHSPVQFPHPHPSQVGPRSAPVLPLPDGHGSIVHPHGKLPPPQARPEVLKQASQLPLVVPLAEVHPSEVRAPGGLGGRAPAPIVRPRGLGLGPPRHGRLVEGRGDAEVVEPARREREGRNEGNRLEGRLEQRLRAGRGLAQVAGRVVGEDPALPRPVGEVLPLEGC